MGSKLTATLTKLQKKYDGAFVPIEKAGVFNRTQFSSPNLNYLFTGKTGVGIADGRIYMFHGAESAGKTALCCYIGGEYQRLKPDKKVIYVDLEYAFDRTHAENVGLNMDEVIFIQPTTGEEMFDILEPLVRTGEISAIVIDSLATMGSSAEMESDYGAGFVGAKTASLMSTGLKKITGWLHRTDTTMLVINQERANMSLYGGDYTTPGGKAIKFYSSGIYRASRKETILVNKEPIGICMKIRNIKNKVGYPYRTAEMVLHYNGGFQSFDEIVEWGIKLGVIFKGGGGNYKLEFVGDESKVRGLDNFKEYLRENPQHMEVIEKAVRDRLVDKDDVEELEMPSEEEIADLTAIETNGLEEESE